MLGLRRIHHITIIATDYAASKASYCDVLGSALMSEAYREERDSWKGDLALGGQYMIGLLSFLSPPRRPNRPEACGLRHLVFSVEDVEKPIMHLEAHHVKCESIHIDPFAGKHFTSSNDPDGSPLELYELQGLSLWRQSGNVPGSAVASGHYDGTHAEHFTTELSIDFGRLQ